MSDQAPLATLIAELAAGDPAAGPDIADEIAARLEDDLATASSRVHPAEVQPEVD